MPEVTELEDLHRAGFRPRKGQLVMVAGQSKTGKSAFVQFYVDRINRPGLYFSADMSARDTATRLVAMNTGLTTDAVSTVLDSHDEETIARYEDVLRTRNTMFNFQSSPSLDDIVEEVSTYVDVYDEYPDVIVVDTLQKVREGEGGDYAGQSIVMDELHSLTRITGALVIVIHHTSETTKRGVTFPPAKADLKNKLSELPELIITVALEPNSQLYRVAVVASRTGRSDATGETYTELVVDMEKCTFGPKPAMYGWTPGEHYAHVDEEGLRWDQR